MVLNLIVKIIVAAMLGGIIGFDREKLSKKVLLTLLELELRV